MPQGSNPSAKRRANFPRTMRLLRHADFERVYKSGRRHFSPSLTAFYLARQAGQTAAARLPVPAGLRVGFTVSRAFGGAVERNRMKRRLREAVRLSPLPVLNADVVINPKKSLLTTDFEAVLNEVRRVFVTVEQKLAQPEDKSREVQNESDKIASSPNRRNGKPVGNKD